MKILRLGNSLTLVLLLVSLLLGIGVSYQLNRLINLEQQGSFKTANPLPAESVELDLQQDVFIPPTRSALNEILERPLFTEDRTPPEVPDAAAKSGQAAKSVDLRLRLEGIVITPEKRMVLVRDLGSNEFLKLPEGITHQGWLIDGIKPGRAVFKRGDQSHELIFELVKEPKQKQKRTAFQKKFIRKRGITTKQKK